MKKVKVHIVTGSLRPWQSLHWKRTPSLRPRNSWYRLCDIMTNRYTVHFHGSYLLYAVSLFLACLMVLQSNRVREMQVELRELRQWTSLVCGDIKESSTDISRCGVGEFVHLLIGYRLHEKENTIVKLCLMCEVALCFWEFIRSR